VIRERDNRYISLPIVLISLVNSSLWTVYAIIKKDIPFFMTNFLAINFMSINLIFYLWALDLVSTESIQSLITLFTFAVPQSDLDFNKEIGLGHDKEDLEQANLNAEKAHAREVMAREYGYTMND
jgi:hypothetical protein